MFVLFGSARETFDLAMMERERDRNSCVWSPKRKQKQREDILLVNQ